MNNYTIIWKTLYYIYLNRYRQLSSHDYSKFLILCGLYLVSYIYLFTNTNIWAVYLTILVFVFNLFSINFDRQDYGLLANIFGKINRYFIILTDNLIFNIPILFILIFKNIWYIGIPIILILIISGIKMTSNFKLINPFSAQDPLWILFFRKYPIVLIMLGGIYYLGYDAIKINNHNLLIGAYISILYLVLNIESNREKLYFIKISKLSVSQYINNVLEINILNVAMLLTPLIGIEIGMNKINTEWFSSLVIYILIVINIISLKYIFYSNNIVQNIISMIFMIGMIAISMSNSNIFYLLGLIGINLLLFSFSKRIFYHKFNE